MKVQMAMMLLLQAAGIVIVTNPNLIALTKVALGGGRKGAV